MGMAYSSPLVGFFSQVVAAVPDLLIGRFEAHPVAKYQLMPQELDKYELLNIR